MDLQLKLTTLAAALREDRDKLYRFSKVCVLPICPSMEAVSGAFLNAAYWMNMNCRVFSRA